LGILEGFFRYCQRIGGNPSREENSVVCVLPREKYTPLIVDIVQTKLFDIEKRKYMKKVRISTMHPVGDFEFYTNNDVEISTSFSNGKGFTTYSSEEEHRMSSFYTWLDKVAKIVLTKKKEKLSIEIVV